MYQFQSTTLYMLRIVLVVQIALNNEAKHTDDFFLSLSRVKLIIYTVKMWIEFFSFLFVFTNLNKKDVRSFKQLT